MSWCACRPEHSTGADGIIERDGVLADPSLLYLCRLPECTLTSATPRTGTAAALKVLGVRQPETLSISTTCPRESCHRTHLPRTLMAAQNETDLSALPAPAAEAYSMKPADTCGTLLPAPPTLTAGSKPDDLSLLPTSAVETSSIKPVGICPHEQV